MQKMYLLRDMVPTRLNVTLSQLEALIAAADTGSLSNAAAALHTSQSNVSVSMAKLERLLGVELLVRYRSKGVGMTAIGQEIATRAKEIVNAVRDLEHAASGELDELQGALRIGCFLPLTPFYIPRLMADIRERSTTMDLVIREGTQDMLQRAVFEGELDLALVYDRDLPAQLDFHPLASVWPYVIVPPHSALADRSTVSLAELSTHTMVNYELTFTAGRAYELFEAARVALPNEMRATSLDSVRALVAAGVGFSILNQRWGTNITADGAEVVPVEILDDVEPMRLGVITRARTRSARVTLAISLLRAQAQRRHSEGDRRAK